MELLSLIPATEVFIKIKRHGLRHTSLFLQPSATDIPKSSPPCGSDPVRNVLISLFSCFWLTLFPFKPYQNVVFAGTKIMPAHSPVWVYFLPFSAADRKAKRTSQSWSLPLIWSTDSSTSSRPTSTRPKLSTNPTTNTPGPSSRTNMRIAYIHS